MLWFWGLESEVRDARLSGALNQISKIVNHYSILKFITEYRTLNMDLRFKKLRREVKRYLLIRRAWLSELGFVGFEDYRIILYSVFVTRKFRSDAPSVASSNEVYRNALHRVTKCIEMWFRRRRNCIEGFGGFEYRISNRDLSRRIFYPTG